MLASVVVYLGGFLAIAGAAMVVRPLPRLGITTRLRASLLLDAAIVLVLIGLLAPAREARAIAAGTKLDVFAPVWQFRELHSIRVAAPPDRVFAAIKEVRADEIFLFRALT